MRKNAYFIVWLILATFAVSNVAGQEMKPIEPVTTAVIDFGQLAARREAQPDTPVEPRAIHRPRRVPRDLPIPPDAPVTREPFVPQPELTQAPKALLADPLVTGFLALGDNNKYIPPDTNGAVGPNHVVTALNSEVRVQNRSGGNISTVTLNSFWAATGASGVFDPRLLYDPVGGRWIAAAVSNAESAQSSLLVGASRSSDPTGLWNLYRFDADITDQNWADFPMLGFDRNWIVVTVNMFPNSSYGYAGAKVFVITRSQLLAGGSLTARMAQASSNSFSMAPATSYDAASGTLYLVEDFNGNWAGAGYLRMSQISGAVGSETFTEEAGYVTVAATWTWQAATEDSAPQLGSSQRITNNDSRMGNCVKRFQSLWCAQPVFLPASNPNRSSVQWLQFNPVTLAVQQFGRIDDSTGTKHFAFPSIAVNRSRDVLVGYSVFSPNTYASSGFSFRYGADPANTLRASKIFKSGEASYYKTYGGSSNRWGDYSSTVVDPVDDLTLWTLQEYAWTPSSRDLWSTWWLRVSTSNVLYFPIVLK